MKRLALVLAAALLAALAPATAAADHRFPDRIELPAGFQPEGIERGRGTTVYVGSLADGAIWRGDVRIGEGSVWAPGRAGRVTVGLAYDRARRLLWAAGGPTGEVRAYDARTGRVVATYTFTGTGFLNDVTVTRRGVYVTDSLVQQFAVIPLRPGRRLPAAGELLPITGDLVYQPGFNANGIVDRRGFLLVVQSNTGQLFRVDPDTGDSLRVDVHGATLTNGDGMELRGRTLWVVRNFSNLVVELRLGPRLTRARVVDELTDPSLDVPTTATFVAGSLYVVNARFGTPPQGTAYWITRL